MAKRFSETDKWKDRWFVDLSPVEKLVFNFLCDYCDNAGFFEANPKIHAPLIGISADEYLGAIKGLGRGLLGAKNGETYWIKNFLFHQKNLPLNPNNNAHKQIIGILVAQAPHFDIDFEAQLGAYEGLISPIGRGIGKGKEGGMGETAPSVKGKFVPPTIDEFKTYFRENGFREDVAERAWKAYDANSWKDSRDKPVKNWKSKCQNVWFREEHKIIESASATAGPDTESFFNTAKS